MHNGLPIHIGAAPLGHLNLQTTQGYVAVFEEHFEKRKVELGSCGRPDLEIRKKRASAEGWLGEIEGIDRTLQRLRDKRADVLRLTRTTHQVNLGMPTITTPR